MPGINKTDMNALRFLLIHGDSHGSTASASLLADAHHAVVAAPNLAEAAEALYVERFDAVILDASLPLDGSGGIRCRSQANRGASRLARIPMVSVSSETATDVPLGQESPAWDEWSPPAIMNRTASRKDGAPTKRS